MIGLLCGVALLAVAALSGIEAQLLDRPDAAPVLCYAVWDGRAVPLWGEGCPPVVIEES